MFAVLGGIKRGVCSHAWGEGKKKEAKQCGAGGQLWSNKKEG